MKLNFAGESRPCPGRFGRMGACGPRARALALGHARAWFALALALAALVLAVALPAFAFADEGWMDAEPRLGHVTDAADILTDSEEQALEQQAQLIEDEYDFGVYIVVLEDYSYQEGSVFNTAVAVYEEYSLGVGPGKDGLLLLLAMAERDYSLVTYGDFGNYAFSDGGRIAMTEYFLDDFRNDFWYAGFADFLTAAEDYLDAAIAGAPYTQSSAPLDAGDLAALAGVALAGVLIVPFVIMLIVIAVMDSKMKSVAPATQASAYVSGALALTNHYDAFSHVTEVVVPIANSGGGGGPSTGRIGGFSGTSGKF